MWWCSARSLARRIVAFDRQIIAEGASRTFDEVATSAGVERTYRTTEAPYRDGRGSIVGVIGIARDITEPRRAEEELRETREFLSRLLDHAPSLIYVADRAAARAWSIGPGSSSGD